MSYSSGKHALGICDRCGFTYKLHELRDEYVRGVPQNLKTCESCWDDDHPQNYLDEIDFFDPQSLEDPRPDSGKLSSTSLSGWKPVLGIDMTILLGRPTVGSS